MGLDVLELYYSQNYSYSFVLSVQIAQSVKKGSSCFALIPSVPISLTVRRETQVCGDLLFPVPKCCMQYERAEHVAMAGSLACSVHSALTHPPPKKRLPGTSVHASL